MAGRGNRREGTDTKDWFIQLVGNPVTLFTAVAAIAAACSAFLSLSVSRQAAEDEKLNTAAALYLDCGQIPGHTAPFGALYYQVFDPANYPGALNEGVQSELRCKVTNISAHTEVNIRLGFLALFGPPDPRITTATNPRQLIFPDDAVYFTYGDRKESLNLAPGSDV